MSSETLNVNKQPRQYPKNHLSIKYCFLSLTNSYTLCYDSSLLPLECLRKLKFGPECIDYYSFDCIDMSSLCLTSLKIYDK